ncbi:MAG: VWA domain-containing protein [Acidobacteriota bacterium]
MSTQRRHWRSQGANRALGFVLLSALLFGSVPGSAAQDLRTLWIWGDRGTEPPEVLEQGLAREVVDLAVAPEGSWRVIVYVDLPMSSPELLDQALEWTAEAAERLVALGTVEVLSAETVVQQVLEPTRDAAEVRAALDHVAGANDVAGELQEMLLAPGSEPEESEVLDAFFEQEELLAWQEDLFADSLWSEERWQGGSAGSSAPVAVLWIGAPSTDPVRQARELVGERASVRFEPRLQSTTAERREGLERALAASGFALFPIVEAGGQTSSTLAEATGGREITDSSQLANAITELESVRALRYRTAALPIDEPYPLDLRAPGASFRSPRWATTVTPRFVSRSRARRFSQGESEGRLQVTSRYLEPESGSSFLETLVEWPEGEGRPDDSAVLRVTVVRRELDAEPVVTQAFGNGSPLETAWVHRQPVTAPDEADLTVVVEQLDGKLWGAATADVGNESLMAEAPGATLEEAGSPPPVVRSARRAALPDAESPKRPTAADLIGEPQPRPEVAAAQQRLSLLKIVPPRARRLRGRHEFKILLTNMAIRKVAFELDGELVGEDAKRPFDLTIDLGQSGQPRSLVAIGYSGQGSEMTRDRIEINPSRQRTGVFLTEVQLQGDESVRAEASVSLASQSADLDRVEIYRNETLGATLTRPPYRTTLPGPGRADADYVRVVAYLKDGTFLEDVRLLGSDTVSESVDVNLVEVYAVVTDENGDPVQGLEAEAFEVSRKGDPVLIDRFAVADEASLEVGLVVDTSLSMYSLMPDTRKAAARFLSDLLTPIDRAFLVDFDNRPRLAHPTTGRLTSLLSSLGSLRAGGSTALYDSILFALLHYERGLGRKALVLLTDGDDVQSQFSYRRVYQTAAASGLPVYFLALGGFDDERPSFRKSDLEAIAKSSGGRVFYPSSMDDVNAAYRKIGSELRSQYVLAFSTEELLDENALEEIRVKLSDDLRGKKYKIRFVAGLQ